MDQLPCTLENSFGSELIGAFSEVRKWKGTDGGIVSAIQTVTKERLATLCEHVGPKKQEEELEKTKTRAQKAESNIITFLSEQIEPQELAGFFRFWGKNGDFVQSPVFQDIYLLYALRHGTGEADRMKKSMSDTKDGENRFILLEYGRNKQNEKVFIQRIWFQEEQTKKDTPTSKRSERGNIIV